MGYHSKPVKRKKISTAAHSQAQPAPIRLTTQIFLEKAQTFFENLGTGKDPQKQRKLDTARLTAMVRTVYGALTQFVNVPNEILRDVAHLAISPSFTALYSP